MNNPGNIRIMGRIKKNIGRVHRRIFRLFRRISGHMGNQGFDDSHNLSLVGYLRYVQNIGEEGPRKNPDNLVKYFLSDDVKKKAKQAEITTLRADSFYHYLLARTKFYDKKFNDAIVSGIKQIVILGVGTDTRAYRFKHNLLEHSVTVIETDLEPWITARTSYIEKLGKVENVRQCELDLEHVKFDSWITKSSYRAELKTLFLAEGVTPYIIPTAVDNLLSFIRDLAPRGSRIAYDFKLAGLNDDFGVKENGEITFRLPNSNDQIERFHSRFGLVADEIIFSQKLQKEFLDYDASLFWQDAVFTATRL